MSRGIAVLLGILGVGFLMVLVVAMSAVGTYNSFVTMEKGVVAQYSQNQNNYDNMWKKFKESAQVSDMYTDKLKDVFDSAIKARYGAEGSKAVFQFLKEHNPNFDASLFKQLQAMIESGRNTFEANQKMLLDKKQIYETSLSVFPSNLIAGVFGFPKIDLAKYDIVTSDATSSAFESKKAEEVNIYKK